MSVSRAVTTPREIIQPNASATVGPLPHNKRNEDLVVSQSLASVTRNAAPPACEGLPTETKALPSSMWTGLNQDYIFPSVFQYKSDSVSQSWNGEKSPLPPFKLHTVTKSLLFPKCLTSNILKSEELSFPRAFRSVLWG